MRHQAKVVSLINEDLALVSVTRDSACGHDCGSCQGCGLSSETISARAINKIGAIPGDTVTLETDTTAVIGIAAVVYLLPIILFFSAYIICKLFIFTETAAIICGALGFIAGVLVALLTNKRVTSQKNDIFVIISVDSGDN